MFLSVHRLKILVGLILLWVFTHTVIFFINRTVRNLKKRHLYRKGIVYLSSFITLAVGVHIILPRINVSLILGIGSAGVALALQEAVLSLAGWLYILVRRPYDVGDRIEVSSLKGDVIDIRAFQTTLLEVGNWVDGDQSTGRIIHLPNSFIFKHPTYNYTRGFEFIWNELSVVITFNSNFEKAKEILIELGNKWSQDKESIVAEKIRRMADNYMIHFNKYTPIVYTFIVDSGIKLTLRYMIETKQRRSTTSNIFEEFLRRIESEPDITLAYTTYKLFYEPENRNG